MSVRSMIAQLSAWVEEEAEASWNFDDDMQQKAEVEEDHSERL